MEIDDLIDLMVIFNESDIDFYYNDEMGFFPSTIFDGYDLNYRELIINKSIMLPKPKGIIEENLLKEKINNLILDFCRDNNISI